MAERMPKQKRRGFPPGFEEPKRTFQPADPPAPGLGRRAGPKRAVNLSVDAVILGVARDMKINLSQVLEEELRRRTQDERNRRFREEHREAFEAHNKFIEEHGIWGKKYRPW